MKRKLARSLFATLFAVVGLASCNLANSSNPSDWVGKPLPEMKLNYLDPAPDLKGRPAIVEFWATWCPPCRQSIPHLNELYKKYKDRGLVIVGISDEDKSTVEKFRQSLPMDYTVALDPEGGLIQKFGLQGIPHAFVVDKSGRIVWDGHPMALKDDTLEKVLQ